MRGQNSSKQMGIYAAYQYAKQSEGSNHAEFQQLAVKVAKEEYKTKTAQLQFVEGWLECMERQTFTLK